MDVIKSLFKIGLFVALLSWQQSALARTWTITNNCSQPVWFGFIGGKPFPAPANNNYKLDPGSSNTVNIPGAQWSGVIAGRTNCAGGVCETGDCGGGEGACTHGFNQPATQAEFTTVPTGGNDFYDVEVINGFNLPISITPSVAASANNPYFCGTPGAVNPSPGMGSCSWQFAPPLVEYNWVQNGGKACTASTDCTGGTICGLSFNPGQQQLLQKTCGKQLGYWTANQICGIQRNYGAPFNCSEVPPNQPTLTWWNLFACVPPIGCEQPGNPACSCYQNGANSSCCGCVNWDKIGLPVPPGPTTQQCNSTNPNWNNHVQPTLEWLKRGCPTAYTYPFDDVSSTFQCSTGGNNQANYTITFCPGGQVPPSDKTGKIKIAVAGGSDKACMNANDTLTIDQDHGIPFPVTNKGISTTASVGKHTVALASQTGIPAGNGTCTSTLNKTKVTVKENASTTVTATYTFKSGPPPTGNFSFNVNVASPFLTVTINDSITCPDSTGKPICLVSNQAVGSDLTIKGQNNDLCSLRIKADGTVSSNANSVGCFINVIPATPTKPGSIALPSKF